MCPSCGAELTTGEAACHRCGAPVPPSASRAAGAAGAGFGFDANRLTAADRTCGIATIVVLIGVFLPWFGLRVTFISARVSGLGAHGFLYIVVLVCLAVLAELVTRGGFESSPVTLPLERSRLLLGATGVNFVLVLIAFVDKPGGSAVGWSWGAVVTLVAAVVALSPYGRSLRLTSR